jgi:hypothetical protein
MRVSFKKEQNEISARESASAFQLDKLAHKDILIKAIGSRFARKYLKENDKPLINQGRLYLTN